MLIFPACLALLFMAIHVSAGKLQNFSSSTPILVEAKSYYFQFWNRQMAKIAQSVFKLSIYPIDSNAYTATAFLCTIELQGAVRSGTHYGFITVNHGINLGFIVPVAGARMEAIFDDDSDTFWLTMHVDTAGWFTDEFLDVTFFELKPQLVRSMMVKGREFLPITASGQFHRNVEFDLGRELFMFAIASDYSQATFVSGRVIESVTGTPGDIYHNIESRPGTSGGPLVDRGTYQVVGLHKAYSQSGNYRIGVSSWAIIARMEQVGLAPPASKNDSEGWTLTLAVRKLAPLFHEAVKRDNLGKAKEIVDEVRSKLANPSPYDSGQIRPLIEHRLERSTPLIDACNFGHLSMVKFLVRDCGADVFYRGSPEGGFSPFLNASYTGKFELVKLMLELRPDILESRNIFNNTALNFAAVAGKLKVIEFLVDEHKANINNRGYLGRSPLFMAASSFLVEPVKFFLSKGAEVTLRSDNGETVIHFLASYGHRELVELLLKAKPDLVSILDSKNETILHRAAYRLDSGLVEYLTSSEKMADQMAKNGQGRTPLLIAASVGNLGTVAYLASQGSDLTGVDNFGNNALHLAAQGDHLPLAQFLMIHEPAMAARKNKDGNDALTVAKKAASKSVLDFLISKRKFYHF